MRCRQELNSCDYCSITYLKELKFCDEYCDKIIGLFIFLFFLSDPYEQVVLPVDGLKEEEPVEPYQKIGPSKTVWCTCGTQISVHKIHSLVNSLIGFV